MKLLQGRIARQVIFAFFILALIATSIAFGFAWLVRYSEQVNLRARKSAELALLSAQIRSEALTLTNMVQNYIVIGGNRNERARISVQNATLDALVERAILAINEQDVEESIRLGDIRQNLIAFKTQANQALNIYDTEAAFGPATQQELFILTEHYQFTLVRALSSFENFETEQADRLWENAQNVARQALNFLLFMVVVVALSALGMTNFVARRFVFPLGELYVGVQEIEDGNLNHIIPILSKDEMGDLANALNKMSFQLQESQQKLKGYSAELESEVRKLSTAVIQSPNAIIITNINGQIEYANPQFTSLTGYEYNEVIGENPRILKSEETSPETYADMWQTISNGNVWRGELRNKTKDGKLYWEASVIAPIRNINNQITHYVAIKEDISERKKVEETLHQLATTDTLTQTLNRHKFFSLAKVAFSLAKETGRNLSILMMDADNFKNVNDRFGHQAGDEVLRGISDVIKEIIRDGDYLGRYGGEEFVIALPNTDLETATHIAERICQYIHDKDFMSGKNTIPVTISIGVACLTDEATIDGLMFKADLALYQAKHRGRNRVCAYKPEFSTEEKNS